MQTRQMCVWWGRWFIQPGSNTALGSEVLHVIFTLWPNSIGPSVFLLSLRLCQLQFWPSFSYPKCSDLCLLQFKWTIYVLAYSFSFIFIFVCDTLCYWASSNFCHWTNNTYCVSFLSQYLLHAMPYTRPWGFTGILSRSCSCLWRDLC